MKPLLIVGLGNPLMGDDGVGCAVAERLAGDPRLPEGAEVAIGGTDLLRFAASMEGRSRLVAIDAVEDAGVPGTVRRLGEGDGLDERQEHAHHLSVVQAMRLLEMTTSVPCTLLGISIESVRAGSGLSPELSARLPEIVERVLFYLQKV